MRFSVGVLSPISVGVVSRLPSLARPSVQASMTHVTEQQFALLADYATVLDEGSRPVSDLFQNTAAVGYLGVLTVLFGFLAYLAVADRRAKARREDALDEAIQEMDSVSAELSAQGKMEESRALSIEAGRLRTEGPDAQRPGMEMPSFSMPPKPSFMGKDAPVEEDGNRFARRQEKTEAKKKRTKGEAREIRTSGLLPCRRRRQPRYQTRTRKAERADPSGDRQAGEGHGQGQPEEVRTRREGGRRVSSVRARPPPGEGCGVCAARARVGACGHTGTRARRAVHKSRAM